MTIERTLDQRMKALEHANAIRSLRSTLRRNLKDGSADVYRILDDPAPELHTMKLRLVLLALPKWGDVKTRNAMRTCRISWSKTLGGLSFRQRGEIAAYLRKKGV